MTTNRARLVKQQREERALARLAKEDREREEKLLAMTQEGTRLLANVDALRSLPISDWLGFMDTEGAWLRTAHPYLRTTATRFIGELWDEAAPRAGLDPMDEPLWDQEPSVYQQIRWALANQPAPAPVPPPPAAPPAPSHQTTSLKIMLTINISGPNDVPALRDTVSALNAALCGSTAPAALATTANSHLQGATAEEAAEATKRKRRTKAEMEAAAQQAPAASTEPAPEPAAADEDDLDALLDDSPAAGDETPKTPWDHCYTTTYTQDEVNKAFREWALKAGGAATRHVLNHLGVAKSSEIKPEQYSELMALLIGKPI